MLYDFGKVWYNMWSVLKSNIKNLNDHLIYGVASVANTQMGNCHVEKQSETKQR